MTSLPEALHAEWTKLRTLPGTAWLLLGIITLTITLSVLATATVTCGDAHCGQDPAKVSLTGVEFGQAGVVVLAVLAISGEYATGMIRVSLTAVPRRLAVLAAKSILISAAVLLASTIAIGAALLIGRFLLPGNGFTTAHGYAALSLGDGAVLRAATGSALYLVLIGLLSIGVATLVRDGAAAIGIVLGLLYLFPIVATVVSDPTWYKHLQQIGPMTAGLAVQATRDLAAQPISPWAGLGVVALWAAGALGLGGLLLHRRDA